MTDLTKITLRELAREAYSLGLPRLNDPTKEELYEQISQAYSSGKTGGRRGYQNDVIAPAPGSKEALLWDLFTQHTKRKGKIPLRATAIRLARLNDMKLNTALNAYYAWRKYHGVTGRVRFSQTGELIHVEESDHWTRAGTAID